MKRAKMVTSSLSIATIIVVAVLVSGCDDPNYVTAPYYEYTLRVSGLENFTTDSGFAYIMVPVPAINGSVYLPFKGPVNGSLWQYTGGGGYDTNIVDINNWDYHGTRYIAPVETANGSMLYIFFNKTDYFQFRGDNSPYYPSLKNKTPDQYGVYTFDKTTPTFDDINVRIRQVIGPIGDKGTNARLSSLRGKPLMPEIGNAAAKYTIPLPGVNITDYTSIIYIDQGLRPAAPGNHTIEITAKLEVVEGYHPYDGYGDHRLFAIRESIPEGVTGYVPITVQCLGSDNPYPQN